MIVAELRDAGTRQRYWPAWFLGNDRYGWVEGDGLEELPNENFIAARNTGAVLWGEGHTEVRPWPVPLPKHCFVDYTDRYRDVPMKLAQRNELAIDGSEHAFIDVPLGERMIVPDWRRQAVLPIHAGASDLASAAEVRSWTPDGAKKWVRNPWMNESGGFGGGTGLENPLIVRWDGIQNARYALIMGDDYIWAPFNLTHPEWYDWVDDHLRPVDPKVAYGLLSQHDKVVVYLMPRRLRYLAEVIAHYIYVTFGQLYEVYNDEVFIQAWFDRPPFFPTRHNLRDTIGDPQLWHPYYSVDLAYDAGVDMKFQNSRAYMILGDAIVNQQIFSLCFSYILTGVEPARITVAQYPPRQHEIVVGIGRHGGYEHSDDARVWAIQKVNLDEEYPPQALDIFYAPFGVDYALEAPW